MPAAAQTPTASALRAPGRIDAWSELGISVADQTTADGVLEAAHLRDWNVRLWNDVSVTHLDETGVTTFAMPDTRAAVRTNPVTGGTEYLGRVGGTYTPVQIEEHTALLNAVAERSGATFHRAGGYKGGRRYFVSMSLPHRTRVGGFDDHRWHLTLFGSHDTRTSNSLHIGATRADCANMQRLIIAGAQHSYRVRHTANAKFRLGEIEQALATLLEWPTAFEREADRLLNTPLTLGQFEDAVTRLWPTDPNPGPRTRRNSERRMATLRHLFEDAPTQESIRGTAWAGWNAIGEYLDHHAPARTAALRAARALSETGESTKQKTAAAQLFTLAA